MTAQTVNPFAGLVGHKTKTRLMVEVMTDEMSRRFGVAYIDVMGHGRPYPIVEARHWAWWLLVRRYGQSQMGVGRAAGWDASTVWHAVHKMDRRVRRGEIPEVIADLVSVCPERLGEVRPGQTGVRDRRAG